MKKIVLLAMALVILSAGAVLASGFRVPEQGAAAMGMCNAWLAQADDPSAIALNPAGIAQIGKWDVEAGVTILMPTITHEDKAGADTDTKDVNFVVPNVYAVSPLYSGWSFGLGVSTPFGLGTEWDKKSFARYSSTKTLIELVNINPTVAYKLNDSLMFGAGIDLYTSTVDLRKQIWLGPGKPDGSFKMTGDGNGWGFNLGLLYKITPDYSLGVTYRSQVEVEYDGDATFDLLVAKLKSPGTADLTYPGVLGLGIAGKITPALLVEADVEWTDWSVYDKLTINFDKPAGPIPAKSTSDKSWKDTYTLRLGGKYQFNDALTGRLGYLYDQSPVPDSHYDTLLPDGKARHGVSAGVGYKMGAFSVDASYLALFQTKRTINKNNPELASKLTGSSNPALGGTDVTGSFTGFTNLLAVQISYKF